MAVQDRRIQRTQRRLAEALIALTLEQGYDAVTIREITERAGVGYATFFRRYRDKDGLLQDVADVVLEELMALLAPADPDADPAAAGAVLFRYVAAHAEVVRVLLGSRAVLRRLIAMVTARIVAEHEPRPGAPAPLEIGAHHLVASTVALVGWWLDHDMAGAPEAMGRIYAELIAGPTSALTFGPQPRAGD
jgi:AcrR family transcriptional regulator